ncbi:uncharacterized protein LOC110727020 [Chenopodium quinoa]|uniref:uncharacterized protein LOC110727020 n=1 Tax=Chenopodium quinoa TaxID=63459 RepID=UPI000B793303|nr:uncharacterized protein LOC110727020 [Chenopodium quinoa]
MEDIIDKSNKKGGSMGEDKKKQIYASNVKESETKKDSKEIETEKIQISKNTTGQSDREKTLERKKSREAEKEKTEIAKEKEIRPQREIPNVPLAFRSPYMVKYKDLFKDEDTMNKLVTDYAYSGKDQSELLYYDGVNSINREEMKTLEGDTLVVNNVIDSWAVLLNQKRSKNKLYFSTFPHQIMYANTVCPEGSSMELRIAYFKERITNELRLYKIKSAVGYQQIFFPVAIYAHFYLLCIDHINETMHIIDNRKLPKHQTIATKYENQPQLVVSILFNRYINDQFVYTK